MDAKTVVRADAAFEDALGLALVVAGATGALGAADFPHPVGRAFVVAVGAVLLGVAVLLWSGRVSLAPLAAGNVLTAIAAIAWLGFGSGFSAAGAAVLAATAAGLVALAAVQVATLRR
jgi:hypothetical protein